MHYTPMQRLWWVIYWFFLITSFCVIGFFLVAQATGYRYNTHVGRWQKTGMLILSSLPKDSYLEIDGQRFDLSQSSRIPNILPGTYRLLVEREGYLPWEETVTIKPGFVATFDPIVLFFSKPINVPVTSELEELIALAPQDRQVRIVDGELWIGTQLVSRFVDPPVAATLLSTGRHIVYIQKNEVRVIETNGRHDTLLANRNSDNPPPVVVTRENIILFKDGEQTKALQIR